MEGLGQELTQVVQLSWSKAAKLAQSPLHKDNEDQPSDLNFRTTASLMKNKSWILTRAKVVKKYDIM